jgi:hypothetical protein
MANLGSIGASGFFLAPKQLPTVSKPTPAQVAIPVTAAAKTDTSALPDMLPAPARPQKTDTATLPGMIPPPTQYGGYTIQAMPDASGRVGQWAILGPLPGMPMGVQVPLTAFPASAKIEDMQAWIDRQKSTPKTPVAPSPQSVAAKQAALPVVSKQDPTVPSPSTGPDLATVKQPMGTGAKVAIGAGAGLLALLALR